MKYLRQWVAKIKELENLSLWQKLNFFVSRIWSGMLIKRVFVKNKSRYSIRFLEYMSIVDKLNSFSSGNLVKRDLEL